MDKICEEIEAESFARDNLKFLGRNKLTGLIPVGENGMKLGRRIIIPNSREKFILNLVEKIYIDEVFFRIVSVPDTITKKTTELLVFLFKGVYFVVQGAPFDGIKIKYLGPESGP
jgi:hypothetical protein